VKLRKWGGRSTRVIQSRNSPEKNKTKKEKKEREKKEEKKDGPFYKGRKSWPGTKQNSLPKRWTSQGPERPKGS